ncbi:hypothetical protein ACXYMW_09090 [Roseivivax sp. CAU 1761]
MDHFIEFCGSAFVDRDAYVEGLSRREGVVAHGLSADANVRAIRYAPFEPAARIAWIEQSLFALSDSKAVITCTVAGFNMDFPSAEEMDRIFVELVSERFTNAISVGGILAAAPGASFDPGPAVPSVSWRMVKNWIDDPDVMMIVNLFSGEFVLSGSRHFGAER